MIYTLRLGRCLAILSASPDTGKQKKERNEKKKVGKSEKRNRKKEKEKRRKTKDTRSSSGCPVIVTRPWSHVRRATSDHNFRDAFPTSFLAWHE